MSIAIRIMTEKQHFYELQTKYLFFNVNLKTSSSAIIVYETARAAVKLLDLPTLLAKLTKYFLHYTEKCKFSRCQWENVMIPHNFKIHPHNKRKCKNISWLCLLGKLAPSRHAPKNGVQWNKDF